VRRKILLKESAKNVVKIRHLILSFSLVYPKVRIELRIRGSSHKPLVFNPTAELKEKLAQVFTLQKVANLEEVETKNFRNWDWFTILPKLNSTNVEHSEAKDSSKEKIEWIYCLFAVNGRPLNPTLPVTRKVIASVNSQLSSILIPKNGNGSVSKISPVWMISISSVQSQDFDINIEPSKDDILFSDLTKVLKVISEFLNHCYQCVPVERKQKFSEDSSTLQARDELMENINNRSIFSNFQCHDGHDQTNSQQAFLEKQPTASTNSKVLQSKLRKISSTPFNQHSITFTAFGAQNKKCRPLTSSPISSTTGPFTRPRLPMSSPVQSSQSHAIATQKKGQYAPPKNNVVGRKNNVSRFGALISQYMSPSSSPVSATASRFSSKRAGNHTTRQKQATSRTAVHQVAKNQLPLLPSLTPPTSLAVSCTVLTRSTRVGKLAKKTMLKSQATIPSIFAKLSRPVQYVRENVDANWITMQLIRRAGHNKSTHYCKHPQNCLVSDLIMLLNNRLGNNIYEIKPRMTLNGWIILE
jgi:DNA mismatch repair ATPase MutL